MSTGSPRKNDDIKRCFVEATIFTKVWFSEQLETRITGAPRSSSCDKNTNHNDNYNGEGNQGGTPTHVPGLSKT